MPRHWTSSTPRHWTSAIPGAVSQSVLALLTLVTLVASSATEKEETTGNHGNGTDTGNHGNGTDTGNHSEHVGIHVAKWNFHYVATPLVMASFIFIVALSKVGYHHANFLSNWIPESCLLIVLGSLVGLIFFLIDPDDLSEASIAKNELSFIPRNFFLFLLPPIMLEAAYSLHDRTFYDNLGTVLLFAVLGTILNFLLIGPIMYGLAVSGAMGEIDISLVSCFMFASFIVAVDPVAVIAIFEEIGVNNTLYFLVFGESLLNDAVTIVIYNMMGTFIKMDVIPPLEIFLGFVSFFTVSLGGLAIGLVIGVLASFISKYTNNVRVVEPLLLFVTAYLSYLMAELFHFSGIISMIGCGLVQAQYAFHNISHKSHTTIKYFMKMFSATCEAVIFLYLGIMLVSPKHKWHTGFILWANIICLIVRFLVVFFLSIIANRNTRLRKIDVTEQFILSYGGLRGAISFSLAIMLGTDIAHKQLFSTCTITIVLSTVFIQGMTIKPFVNLLNVRKKQKQKLSMVQEIHEHVQDHMMAGLEEIVGHVGHNSVKAYIDWIDDMYLKPCLQREPCTKAEHIMMMFEKISLKQHYSNLPGSKVQAEFRSRMIGSAMSIQLIGADGDVDANSGIINDVCNISNDDIEEALRLHPELLDDKKLRRLTKRMDTRRIPRTRHLSMMGFGRNVSPSIPEPVSPTSSAAESPNKQKSTTLRRLPGRRIKSALDQPKDLSKLLSWRPENELHQKASRNLTNEDDSDLLHQMHHKQLLTRCLSTNRQLLSPSNSVCSTPPLTPQHRLSDQTIPLQPITEAQSENSSLASDAPSGDGRKRKRGMHQLFGRNHQVEPYEPPVTETTDQTPSYVFPEISNEVLV